MKNNLTSIDVYFLAKELNTKLSSARIDKIYQISARELKIKLRVKEDGQSELIAAPNYICLTQYPRKTPTNPSSFAMQLRKHLKGSWITSVEQHKFDRIIKFRLDAAENQYVLVMELFSKGNIILCDTEKKIIGLLEWQKWKDRRLGVGQLYEYPPGGRNPLEVDFSYFSTTLKESEKNLASTLATDIGLGGAYAEEVCFRSNITKDQKPNQLTDDGIMHLFTETDRLLTYIREERSEPLIILDDEDRYLDVLPFPLDIYKNYGEKTFSTLTEAVDTYFSEGAFKTLKREQETKIKKKIEKIKKIEENQKETITKLEKKAEEYHEIGDQIYQRFQTLEKILKVIAQERQKDTSWSKIREQVKDKSFNGVKFIDVDNKGSIILEVAEK